MIKLKDILIEIGDASAKAYDWKLTHKSSLHKSGTYRYKFKTEDNTYVVDIATALDENPDSALYLKYGARIMFGVLDEHYGLPGSADRATDSDYGIVTNKGRQFKILSTVIKIIQAFLKEAPDVEAMRIEPVKEDIHDRRRFDFYMAYIKRLFPSAKVTTTKTSKDSHKWLGMNFKKPGRFKTSTPGNEVIDVLF